MLLTVSPRVVAAAVVRLARNETPISRAAERMTPRVRRIILDAIAETQAAMPLDELEQALAFGVPGAAIFVLDDVVARLEVELVGRKLESPLRTAAAGDGLSNAFGATLAAGADATGLCVVGNSATQDRALSTKTVASVTSTGQNSVVTFADGSKAFFKPASNLVNETSVRIVAKEMGALDLLPKMVSRTINDQKGVLFELAEGTRAADLVSKVRFGTGDGQQRAATLDFLLGNADRNANNWLVTDSGRLKLLDHDTLFAQRARAGFIEHMAELEDQVSANEIARPSWLLKPKEMVKDIDTKTLFEDLRGAGVSNSELDQIRGRLKTIRNSDSWLSLLQGR